MKTTMSFRMQAFMMILLLTFACTETKKLADQETTTALIHEANPEIKPIADGKITTSFNGVDVKTVNLWNSPGTERIIMSHLSKGEEIRILKDEDPYYFIETAQGDKRRGYCMKQFVTLVTKRD